MFTISLCMIVKNEEDCLARILSCAQKFADEIIVVDTGSTDSSKEIAKKFTDKVFDFAWCDNFAKARNYAFSLATCDYVMWLDADDFIDENNIKKIVDLKSNYSIDCAESDTVATVTQYKKKETCANTINLTEGGTATPDVFMCKYSIGFDEQNRPALTYHRERILKRSSNFQWEGFVHEAIVPRGKIVYTNIEIQHRKMHAGDPKRNLKLYEKTIKNGHVLNPREQYYYSRELFYNAQYKKASQNFNKFIKLPNTFPPDHLGAHLMLSDCFCALGKTDKAVEILLKYLKAHAPTAEICCKLAYLFEKMFAQDSAIFWYKCAPLCPKQTQGFVREECQEFLPYLELSRLLYKTDFSAAKEYHTKAKRLRPDHPSVLFNEKFFER